MSSNCLRFLFLSLFIAFVYMGNSTCYAQTLTEGKSHRAGAKYKKKYPSIFKSKASKHKGATSRPTYITIYATTAAGSYAGNPCAQRAANSMGFQYVLHYANCEKEHSKSNNFLHNQGAYISIILKNGIFWKHRFKKRAKECR